MNEYDPQYGTWTVSWICLDFFYIYIWFKKKNNLTAKQTRFLQAQGCVVVLFDPIEPTWVYSGNLFKSPSVQLFVLLWKPFHVYVHSTPCVSSLLFIQFLRVAQSHQFLIAKEIDFFYFWYPDQLKLLWLEHVKINAVLKSQQFITFQGWAKIWLRHELVKLSKGCECHRICA